MPPRDTICALASGPPPSAIALVRVSGPYVRSLMERHLSNGLLVPRVATLTDVIDDNGNQIDQSIAVFFSGPNSFTGEDVLELSVHGGRAIVEGVLDVLCRRDGVRLAEPGEFSRRAYEAGKLDLTAAEAVADLVDADTAGQRDQALRQLGGGLKEAYDDWRSQLTQLLGLIEVAVDFPDEGDAPDNTHDQVLTGLEAIENTIGAAMDDQHIGERIRDGFRVALIGAPNAGKSSLLNAIAGRDAAIVTSEPGTTRDLIEVRLSLAGHVVWVVDTAGLRDTENPIEQEGVRRARTAAEDADLRLLVIDPLSSEPADDAEDLLTSGDLIVLNKSDLDTEAQIRSVSRETLRTSAKTGDGVDTLVSAISDRISARLSKAPPPLITRARHREALKHAKLHLSEARSALHRDLGAEFAAEDVRRAIRELSGLMGGIDVEAVLGEVFSQFCIGK